MRFTRNLAAFCAVAALVLAAGPASAAEPGLERGEALFDLCAQCHGAEGLGNQLYLAPSIAGLKQWYVEMQLGKFRKGLRGTHFDDISGMRMRPMSQSLRSEADVSAVAAYVASLAPHRPETTVAGNAQAGKSLYVLCGACHGQNGEGIQAMNAPSLLHTNDWYQVSQLNKFKAGVRGANPNDPTGVLMGPQSPMALTLQTEQSVRDVVAYITTLSR
jgi:cytochrome c553